jgi:predicted enzyme related to lactoylglutathione lyase
VEKLRTAVDNAVFKVTGSLLANACEYALGRQTLTRIHPQFIGVELYFADLGRAREFYTKTLGLNVSDEQPGHHVQFSGAGGFVCLERKGVESYPSQDKAVLFFEVDDLKSVIAAIGAEKMVQSEPTWAVLHDPEGHNVLLLQRSK